MCLSVFEKCYFQTDSKNNLLDCFQLVLIGFKVGKVFLQSDDRYRSHYIFYTFEVHHSFQSYISCARLSINNESSTDTNYAKSN